MPQDIIPNINMLIAEVGVVLDYACIYFAVCMCFYNRIGTHSEGILLPQDGSRNAIKRCCFNHKGAATVGEELVIEI